MSVVISDALTLGTEEFDADNPIVGWQNRVTPTNLSSDTDEDVDHPLLNAANTSTYLRFQQANSGEDLDMQVALGVAAEEVDYVGVARHNWGTTARTIRVFGAKETAAYDLLLHLDGVDAATSFSDSSNSPKTVSARGAAQVDTAASKFGGGSLILAGSGDYLEIPYHADFLLGQDSFTLDMWFNCNLASGLVGHLAAMNSIWSLFRHSDNTVRFTIDTDAGTFTLISSSMFTNGLNTGWHHVAIVRNGLTLYLFIDGVEEGSTAISGTALVPSPSPSFFVGSNGSTSHWNGWLDEVRFVVGLAQWTSEFILPSEAYTAFDNPNYLPIVQPFIPANDTPLLIRFQLAFYTNIKVVAEAPETDTDPGYASVLFVGALLVVERKLQVSFTPLPMGRKSEIVGHRAEKGHFLGRTIVGAWVESSANIRFMSPDWYRENMDDFIAECETEPFFFAWAPISYPREVGYAWTMEVPVPEITHETNLMGITLNMQGIS